jgi:RES domain-containing protein
MGHAGILVPSFAPGAGPDDHNLVLWRWGARRPHKIRVYDPSGRLPKNQLSWK